MKLKELLVKETLNTHNALRKKNLLSIVQLLNYLDLLFFSESKALQVAEFESILGVQVGSNMHSNTFGLLAMILTSKNL